MASTYSSNLRLELITTGEQQGTWGSTTNNNLGTLLEQAITGYASVAVTDGADTTLTTANGSSDQARNMTLNLTGALTAARNVICPSTPKIYVVKNSTTGGFAVTLKVTGQTGISVPNGGTYLLFVDGTDVRQASGGVVNGGTGSSTAAGARTNLGVAIGTNVQAWDADLDAIAALAGTSGFLKKAAANTWTLDTSTYLTSLGIGTLTQAWDADLDAISALAGTSGFLKKTAANTWSLDTSTYLTTSATANVAVGYTVSPANLGTITTGTVTPNPASGNYQYYTNSGAHTIAAPSSDCAIDILVTNSGGGSITFSGYTVGANTGSVFTTAGAKFILSIRRIAGTSTYSWYALQ